ncbi:MAG: transcription antitermination factor NusB [Anaerolineales bacterium]
MKVRRRARIVALQALFETDSVGHPPDVVLQHRLEETPLPDAGVDFARALVFGVLEHRKQLDAFIQKNAPQWPIEQMAIIDRNILRIALFELYVDRTTPMKVVINEAVELAKMFGSESSHRFVNGVLGSFVLQMQGMANPGHSEGAASAEDSAKGGGA